MSGEDRLVERALHATLELAVDEGIGVGSLTLSTIPVDRADQLDRGLRQCTGFIGAQDIHGAEIVDCGEALHDHLSPFFFSSRRRHTRLTCDWSSDVCSSD